MTEWLVAKILEVELEAVSKAGYDDMLTPHEVGI